MKTIHLKTELNNIKSFIQEDLWRSRIKKKSKIISVSIQFLRIIIIAGRGFVQDRCPQKASALTYYSLMSIVPIAAMAFGIAKGFGFDSYLEKYLQKALSKNQEIFEWIMSFSESMLAKTQGGLIAGIGFVILVWSVIKVLGNVEKSFNQIWYINKQRSFVRKISDYMTIMIFAPILFIISISATNSVSNYLHDIAQQSEIISHLYGIISLGLHIIPYSLVWIAFTFLYIIMPNTKVNFPSALLGGVIAGIIFQLVQYFYIKFQIGVSSYNAIYGSFAALPLFLIWLQMSWTIVLLGAEIAYATQNVQNFEHDFDIENLSVSFREKICLLILHTIVTKFKNEESPPTSNDISAELLIPHKIVKHGIVLLLNGSLIHEVKTDNEKTFAYSPAVPIETLDIEITLNHLRKAGTTELPQSDELSKISDYYEHFDKHKKTRIQDI
ncbi:MAG: YihY/virulence factor BrkB family protein [Bacteroidales bacterium]